jgi:subfamily B ATP-binding cassette protein MsbA
VRLAFLVFLGLAVAVLDGIGLSFLLPIVDRASEGGVVAGAGSADGQVTAAFGAVYDALGVPFTLATTVAGAAVVLGVRFGTTILLRVLRVRFVTDYGRAYRRALFERTLGVDVEYLDERGHDDLLNAIVTESSYAAGLLTAVLAFLERGLLTLVYLAVMLFLAPWLTLFAIAVLGGITLGVRLVVEPASVSGRRVRAANEAIQRSARAGVQGVRDVKLYAREPVLLSAFGEAVDERADAIVRLRRNEAIVGNLHQFASAAVVLGLIYLAVAVVDLSLGAVGAFLFAMMRTAPNVSGLQALVYSVAGTLPHVTGVRDLAAGLDAHAERAPISPSAPASGRAGSGRPSPLSGTDVDPGRATAPTDHGGGGATLPARIDRIDVESVAFEYDGDSPVGSPRSILQDVSLTASRGEVVGLVGTSGAGKSTLVSLLTRLYDPTDGRITADGVPIADADLDAWRDRVAVVRQDPYVFTDTLRANVLVGDPDAGQAALDRACRVAGVAAFLDDLPEGYETLLGDDGVRLSGGQRQRVALARALLKLAHADVLVLDEATSNLDAATEAAVYDALAEVAGDRIVLVVTHRLSTLAAADRVYVLADGGVAEVGTHAELLAAGGTYAHLYAARHDTSPGPGTGTDTPQPRSGADHDPEPAADADGGASGGGAGPEPDPVLGPQPQPRQS